MSDYAELSARQSIQPIRESDIFLTLKNPGQDSINIDWKVSFPFPVNSNPTTGHGRIKPYENVTKSWTTDLVRLPDRVKQAASEQEIVVDLRLSGGDHFLDGTRGTLRQLQQRP